MPQSLAAVGLDRFPVTKKTGNRLGTKLGTGEMRYPVFRPWFPVGYPVFRQTGNRSKPCGSKAQGVRFPEYPV